MPRKTKGTKKKKFQLKIPLLGRFFKPKRKVKLGKHSSKKSEGRKLNWKFLVVVLLIGLVLFGMYKYLNYVSQYDDINFIRDNGDLHTDRSSLDNPVDIVLFTVFQSIDTDHSFVSLAYILRIDYKQELVSSISIPVEYYTLTKNDGYDKVRNFRNLGAFLEPRSDITYTKEAIEEFTGIRIDKYISIEEQDLNKLLGEYKAVSFKFDGDIISIDFLSTLLEKEDSDNLDEYLAISSNFLDGFLRNTFGATGATKSKRLYDLSRNIKTNYTEEEFEKLYDFLARGRYRFDGNIIGEKYLVEETVDGKKIEVFNENEIDNFVKQHFENIDIVKEQVRIEVYNGTAKRLWGSYWGRRLANAGLDVIRIGTVPSEPKTLVYMMKNEGLDNSLNEIKRVLPSNAEVLYNDSPGFIVTGDIIIILGEDTLGSEG